MKSFLFSFICSCCFTFTTFGADTLSIFQALSKDSALHMTITTDLNRWIKKKQKEEYQSATITFETPAKDLQQWQVKIRARGNMRKQICFFPPYKIKFSKSDLRNRGLIAQFNDIKVVTSCKSGDSFDEYILKEYMAYKLYNELTEKSFRVQLLCIKYIDSKGKRKGFESYGFLIEPVDELAHRLDSKVTQPIVLNPKYTLPAQINLMVLFQYMIGNTDWAVANSHNMKAFRSKAYPYPFCVPYDFDYAGFVNTPYAVPADRLPIERVTQRHFRGYCRSAGTYQTTAQIFQAKKEQLLQLCLDFGYFSEKTKRSTIEYLNSFFEIIKSKKAFESIIADCQEF